MLIIYYINYIDYIICSYTNNMSMFGWRLYQLCIVWCGNTQYTGLYNMWYVGNISVDYIDYMICILYMLYRL